MIHYFVNPASGRGLGRPLLSVWQDRRPVVIDPANLHAQVRDRVRPGDVAAIAGGDGTVSMVVDALCAEGLVPAVRAAVYPLGTGNDLARALGIPARASPLAFVGRLESGVVVPREVTVWRSGARRFLNYLSLGIDAAMLAAADGWRTLLPGNLLFRQATLGLAGLAHAGYVIRKDTRLRTERAEIRLAGLCGAILSNVGWYLGGARIGETCPAEPRLSLTLVHRPDEYARLVLSRLGSADPVLPYEVVREATLSGPALPVQMDGEVTAFASGPVVCEGGVTFLT